MSRGKKLNISAPVLLLEFWIEWRMDNNPWHQGTLEGMKLRAKTKQLGKNTENHKL